MLLLATICAFLDLHTQPRMSQQTSIESMNPDISDGKRADPTLLLLVQIRLFLDLSIALLSAKVIQ